jgi:hypothetical protein
MSDGGILQEGQIRMSFSLSRSSVFVLGKKQLAHQKHDSQRAK